MRKLFTLLSFFSLTPLAIIASIVLLGYITFTNTHKLFSQAENTRMTKVAYAALPQAEDQFVVSIGQGDSRYDRLHAFLTQYHSPMQPYTQLFIDMADKYNIDFRMLPAISAQESLLCGKEIAGSHNCFGYGITQHKVMKFDSYPQAITTVSAALYKYYFSKGRTTPQTIGQIWNPANTSNWDEKVTYFMGQI